MELSQFERNFWDSIRQGCFLIYLTLKSLISLLWINSLIVSYLLKINIDTHNLWVQLLKEMALSAHEFLRSCVRSLFVEVIIPAVELQ